MLESFYVVNAIFLPLLAVCEIHRVIKNTSFGNLDSVIISRKQQGEGRQWRESIRRKKDAFTAGSPMHRGRRSQSLDASSLSLVVAIRSFAVLRPLKMHCCHQSKGKKRHRAVPLHSPIARRLLHSRESSCILFLFYGSMYTFSFFLASRLPHCGSRDSLALVESICTPKTKEAD
jgi:hypothetical protein